MTNYTNSGIGVLRYFVLFAILSFSGYLYFESHPVFFILLGPPIYLASYALMRVESLTHLTLKNVDFIFLLPITIIYFTVVGLQIKQLLQHRSLFYILSLLALVLFILGLHYLAWTHLTRYITPATL
ncbi:MAG: hypothetical protein H6757_04255 [Candidatus Omnitrophica bacterium]|nr:hypothetical protein [Candidatus Omnitrophota bacterium]